MGNGTEDEPTPDDTEPPEPDPGAPESSEPEPDADAEPEAEPEAEPDVAERSAGPTGPRRWIPRWPERWTHGLVSIAILAALVAVVGTVLTFDYLADRAGEVVVGGPQDPDVPYTPADTTSPVEPGGTESPTGSEPPVSGPPSGSVPPSTTVPAPLGSATGETCVPDGSTTEISVMSFNIKSSRGQAGVQIDLLAQALASWKPDVVLLQEVDKNRPISGSIDMPAYLGERLGYYSTFGANVIRPGESQYGTAILSRFPITSSENTLLPRPAGTQQRGLLHAVIDVDGTSLGAYVTHLEHTSADARLQQVTAIRDLLAGDEGPVVLGGDFNATPGTPVMALARTFVTDTWAEVGTGSGLTAPSSTPRARIDYLLHRGAVEPLDVEVVAGPVSDHRAVAARYAVGTTTTVCVPVFG